MRKLFKYIIFTVGLSCFIYPQVTEKIDLDKYRNLSLDQLLNITVTSASKSEEKVAEAPGVLSVIPQNHISLYGLNSINDILFTQPGFFHSYDYERRTVGFRGLFEGWNNNHLLMLIDGIPFNDNQYGTAYTWEITPLVFAKSVEILRGPGSALYGTNATNGVVSINTLTGDNFDEYSSRLRFGSLNSYQIDFLINKSSKLFNSIMSYSWYKTDGNEYESFDDTWKQGRAGNPTKYLTKDSRSGNYFFVKIDGKKSLKDLSLQYHFQQWEYETGHGWLWMIPNIQENMSEYRNIFVLTYKPKSKSKFKKEISLRYQIHQINWSNMWSPPDVWDGVYPQGMIENLQTNTSDIWGRFQLKYKLENKASIISGIETQIFYYSDEGEGHFSNINLNDDSPLPNPDNKFLKVGPWFEWINKKPVTTLSGYLQYSSGKSVSKMVKIVLGLRYDYQFFSFNAIDKENSPSEKKSFDQLSPRLAIIYNPSSKLSIKLLLGRAFRIPSKTELFGANTWTVASGIREVQPETISTAEIALDYKINDNLNLRINSFYTDFNNQTGYSTGEITQIANIYSTENAGIETELMFLFKNGSGFFNVSYVKRIEEEIGSGQENLIRKSDDLTWAPEVLFNFGISYQYSKFTFSLISQYQGKVKRRDSDNFEEVYSVLRPNNVEAWFNCNFKTSYRISSEFAFDLEIKNIFSSDQYVIKNLSYPFDYKLYPRRIFLGLNILL